MAIIYFDRLFLQINKQRVFSTNNYKKNYNGFANSSSLHPNVNCFTLCLYNFT
jgi:hypothetical protein